MAKSAKKPEPPLNFRVSPSLRKAVERRVKESNFKNKSQYLKALILADLCEAMPEHLSVEEQAFGKAWGELLAVEENSQ